MVVVTGLIKPGFWMFLPPFDTTRNFGPELTKLRWRWSQAKVIVLDYATSYKRILVAQSCVVGSITTTVTAYHPHRRGVVPAHVLVRVSVNIL